MTSNTRVAVIAGAGPGNGQALAQRFAEAGYSVALLARNASKVEALAAELTGARGYSCDVGDPASVSAAFASIRHDLGEVDTLVFNAGSGVFADIETITPVQFEASWRVNAFGGLLCSKEVMPAMIQRGSGNIVFIGATASRRGGIKTAAFAPAKAAQRSLAESMARALWPKGIHVAMIVVDGIVDSADARGWMKDRPPEGFVSPDGVAETAFFLTQQNRKAWAFEVEARPAIEQW